MVFVIFYNFDTIRIHDRAIFYKSERSEIFPYEGPCMNVFKIFFYGLLVLAIGAIQADFSFPHLFNLYSPNVGIDLGTQNTSVCVCQKNGQIKIVANFPSVIAIDVRSRQVIAHGIKAKEMLGKSPDHLIPIRPLQDGVIKDFPATKAMLRYIFDVATNYQPGLLYGPLMIIGVPCSVTDPDVRSIHEIAEKTGAREIYTIMEPMAAAIGAGLAVEKAKGWMIVDIGGGTTDVMVISLRSPVVSHAIRVAGDEIDRSIVEYVWKKYNVRIGEQTAEEIKMAIGAAYINESDEVLSMQIGGMHGSSERLRTITLTSDDIIEACEECVQSIFAAIRDVLNNTPVALATDIAENGILLVGGGANLRGLDKRIEREIGLKVTIPKDPMQAVINGIGKVLKNLDYYRDSLYTKTMVMDFHRLAITNRRN